MGRDEKKRPTLHLCKYRVFKRKVHVYKKIYTSMQIRIKHPVIRKSHCMAVCSIRQFEWNII